MAEPAPDPTYPRVSEVFDALRRAYVPDFGINAIDLGVIAGVTVEADGLVVIEVLAPFEDTGLRTDLVTQIGHALGGVPGYRGGAVRFPKGRDWDSSLMSPLARSMLGLEH